MIRKVCISFFAVLVLLLFLVIAAKVSYDNVGEERVPVAAVSLFGVTVEPVAYDWHAAVFAGLMYKDFSGENRDAEMDFGEQRDALTFAVPDGYDAQYELLYGGESVAKGGTEEIEAVAGEAPGEYELLVWLTKSAEKHQDYGAFSFRAKFTVPPPDPEFLPGSLSLAQGEIFVMEVINVPPEIKPVAKTDLGLSVFTPRGDGKWFAAVPVGNTRKPGKYNVKVQAGEFSWAATVTVKAYAFDTQNLIIDTSNPVISEANSAAAYKQYREKIPPLYDTYDEEIYWEGTFVQPVAGRISTQFGSIRYTNSNWSNPRYHWGTDIAANTGTPVAAPNNGRVVFAEYLLNTGNTVVIEHGGGLKSYYFHMDSLNVKKDDRVKKGDQIGRVGSTGYSTGAHLHFEMRIGNQAINPMMLLSGSASLYSLENREAATD